MFFFKRKKPKETESEAAEQSSGSTPEAQEAVDEPAVETVVETAVETPDTTASEPAPKPVPEPVSPEPQTPLGTDEPPAEKPAPEAARPEASRMSGFFNRMKQGLARTRGQFAEGLGFLLLGEKEIDEELLEDIESQLLVADIGIEASTEIIEALTAQVARKQLTDSGALYKSLQKLLHDKLVPVEQPLVIDTSRQPFVILVVGVNGVGKTTTIGKIARQLQDSGHSVILAAGDTFRAAAVEQLQVWGERNNVPVVAQPTGSDSASVIFDAISSAKARNIDVVIADTAGRLHNKSHLMEELAKVRRVMAKLDVTAPHEVLLVLDAGTGQNAVSQADIFRESAGVTGIALTKLDGTAKGGVIFALTQKHQLPVRYIGVGEGIDDLQPFAAKPFVNALFNKTPDAE